MQKKIQSVLEELHKNRSKFWNISPGVGLFINLIIKDRNYKKILEIGTSNGYSGIWIAEALSKTAGTLYTIESHKKERFSLASQNFARTGLTRHIVQIQGHAPEVIPKTPHKFDLVFLDATKYEYPLYFNAVKTRILKGGLLIADNTDSHRPDLAPFIRKVKKDKTFSVHEFGLGTGILLAFKK